MEASYSEAGYLRLVQDIFRRFPSVQKDGFTPGAYKPGLERMRAFEDALGNPSRRFRSVHVAGTNGKGSVANMLASACTSSGLKTGLFTSPHIMDFRERICVNGELIPKEYVFSFLTEWMNWIIAHELSFFEITTGLAFSWFAAQKVDVAIIETGLGGRLDSTNILEQPQLTIVTSIGLDHCDLLGHTLPEIAAEKAGIFKEGVQAQVQEKNLRTVLAAVDILKENDAFALLRNDAAVTDGILHTASNMHFHGRWERLSTQPFVIADIGHNAHALQHNFRQLQEMLAGGICSSLIIVYGIMADKDLDAILPLMPENATYIFTSPETPRALPADDILRRFNAYRAAQKPVDAKLQDYQGTVTLSSRAYAFTSVRYAVQMAVQLAQNLSQQLSRSASAEKPAPPLIYIGGSTFVVAEALPLFK